MTCLCKRFGEVVAIADAKLHIGGGELLIRPGPSAADKTTLPVPRRARGGIRKNIDSTVTATAVVHSASAIAVSLVLGRRVRGRIPHSRPGGYGWTSS